MAYRVRFTVNGQEREVPIADPRLTLLAYLRDDLALTGTKKGCDRGQCGACTVLIDGNRVNACLTLAVTLEGCAITTIEGLSAPDGSPHPLQAAFVACDGLQCGFCTPGQIMSAAGLLAEGEAGADPARIREGMSGNLCRCGAHRGMIEGICSVAAQNVSRG